MTTSNKYNRSEIMKEAWVIFRQYTFTNRFGDVEYQYSWAESLKRSWLLASEKINEDVNDINSIADTTKGNVWNKRIYFNGEFGSVYAELNNEIWTMGIKQSDITPFNGQLLNSFLNEKANELQTIGIKLN